MWALFSKMNERTMNIVQRKLGVGRLNVWHKCKGIATSERSLSFHWMIKIVLKNYEVKIKINKHIWMDYSKYDQSQAFIK